MGERLDRLAARLGYTPLTSDIATGLASPWADDSHLADVDLAELFGLGDRIRVTRDLAMQLDVVSKVRNTVAPMIGGLPLFDRKGGRRNGKTRSILATPDPSVPTSTILTWTVDQLMFYPCTEWIVLDRDSNNFPSRARHVMWGDAERDSDGNLIKAWGKPYGDRDVIRFDSPLGAGFLHDARDAIRRAIVIEKAAAMAEDNPVPSFELHNEGADPAPIDGSVEKAIDNMLERWMRGRRKFGVGYTSKGIKAVAHGQRLEQLLIEAQKRNDLRLVRKMNAPAWVADVAVGGSALTYNNRASRNWELLDLAAAGYMSAIVDRLSMPDVTPHGWEVRFDTDELTKPDMKTRFEAYALGMKHKFITQEQINAWEGWTS